MARAGFLLVVLAAMHVAVVVQAVPFVVHYRDAEGQGFFDPDLGAARRAAFEFALRRWEDSLAGAVPVAILASMPSDGGGTGDGAILASGGAATIHRNFSGSVAGTWYAASLANQIAGRDLNGEQTAEILIFFNADVDRPDVLGSISWYYGLDGAAGSDIDFVTIALHEIGHGLGFSDMVNPASGAWLSPSDQPGIFDRMLVRPMVGAFDAMRRSERLAAIVSPDLLWSGRAVIDFHGSTPALFTPHPFQPGASIAHWDPDSAPGELMNPSIHRAIHDPGLLLPALVDLGWELAIPSPTPPRPSQTPTVTPTPTPDWFVNEPSEPAARTELVYVANFDDDSVSIIDHRAMVSTIAVGQGPVGVAVAPNGRRAYVANVHDGSISVISTRRGTVVATLPVGSSATSVAATRDGRAIVATDTFENEVVVFDAHSLDLRSRVFAGLAPSAVAAGPDDLVFVAAYGEPAVAVVDTSAGIRRAILPTAEPNLVAIAIASEAPIGFVVPGFHFRLTRIDTHMLAANQGTVGIPSRSQALAIKSDGSVAYVAGSSGDLSSHSMLVLNGSGSRMFDISLLRRPSRMALSADGMRLWVTNEDDDIVSLFETRIRTVSRTLPVGGRPMGIAVADVPSICDGDCDGDRSVTIDELVRAVGIAHGQYPMSFCDAGDHDDDGRLTMREVGLATTKAFTGCAAPPR